eukprot:COSAG03_NODE_449_length_7834_cov_7.818746_8_plen_175_part_00
MRACIGWNSYVGAGLWLGRERGVVVGERPSPAARLKSHPHWSHWLELRALVEDGVAFTRGRQRAASKHAPTAPRSPVSQHHSPVTSQLPRGEERRDSTQKKQGRSSSDKRRSEKKGSEKTGSSGRGSSSRKAEQGAQPLLAAPDDPVAAAPGGAGVGPKATASGGGGRWVHVPN